MNKRNKYTSKKLSEKKNPIRRSKRMTEAYSNELETVISKAERKGLENECIAILITLYQDFDFTADELKDIVENEEIEYDSEYNEVRLSTWDYSFRVFNDYDDAYNAAVEDAEGIFDDLGLAALSKDFDYDMYIDEDWFRDALIESMEYYCYDIAEEGSDTYENRLVEECYDRDLIDDDDFGTDEYGEIDYTDCIKSTDRLVSMFVDDYANGVDNWIQEYIDNFGQEEFNTAVEIHGLVDFEQLSKDCVNIDGVAHHLASYDGDERTVYDLFGQDYYIYRV